MIWKTSREKETSYIEKQTLGLTIKKEDSAILLEYSTC